MLFGSAALCYAATAFTFIAQSLWAASLSERHTSSALRAALFPEPLAYAAASPRQLTNEDAALADAHNETGADEINVASHSTVTVTPEAPFDVGFDTEYGLIRIRLFGSPGNNDAGRFFNDAFAYYAQAGTPLLLGRPLDCACEFPLAIPFR